MMNVKTEEPETARPGGRVVFSPTLRAAAVAGYRWLTVYCPSCNTETDVDLAAIDRHPDASLISLIPEFSCRTCRPNAPVFAKLRRVSRERPEQRARA